MGEPHGEPNISRKVSTILLKTLFQESSKGFFLLGRSCVLRSLAVFSTSSDIYYADAKAVVSVLIAVGPHEPVGTTMKPAVASATPARSIAMAEYI